MDNAKYLINLKDSIYDIISHWSCVDIPNDISIDGMNNNTKIESIYTQVIIKPKTIINLLDDNNKLTLGGFIAIVCRSCYSDDKFYKYLSSRLLEEGWTKKVLYNKEYYVLGEEAYEINIK